MFLTFHLMMDHRALICKPFSTFFIFFSLLSLYFFVAAAIVDHQNVCDVASVIGKEERREVATTEYGQISAVEINDGSRGRYLLQFITLEPNSLFLPVLLHADMVFYVDTGSGSVNWLGEEKKNHIKVGQGDIYRLRSGSVFYLQSSLESTREKLRIYAIFTNASDANPQRMFSGVYSSIADLVLGFDTKVLQAAFQVGEEVAEDIKKSSKPPPIVHAPSKNRTDQLDWTGRIIKALLHDDGSFELNSKKSKQKKNKIFNILDSSKDVENCNGWSTAVNSKKFSELKGSNIGVFVVNLTQGSMMGPHWNPRASEIAIVTHGRGMIHVVCPSNLNETECKSKRFVVKEGDVFYVERFHPMAQMAYNNGTFVFMGFSTMARENYPQFLAGKSSVLSTLDKDILAMAFNVSNKTIDQLTSSQADSTILECLSCAEIEEQRMWEEIEKQRQEEEKKREEEEARKREEEEAKRREEEAKRKEEEKKREEEEAKRKEEEEARKREEEAKRREEEEEEAKRREEEEEAKRREEEEEAKRREEEEEARKREEEKEAKRREEEKEAKRREEEEEARKREEAKRREEAEEAKRREEAKKRGEEEEEEARRQEEGGKGAFI